MDTHVCAGGRVVIARRIQREREREREKERKPKSSSLLSGRENMMTKHYPVAVVVWKTEYRKEPRSRKNSTSPK